MSYPVTYTYESDPRAKRKDRTGDPALQAAARRVTTYVYDARLRMVGVRQPDGTCAPIDTETGQVSPQSLRADGKAANLTADDRE